MKIKATLLTILAICLFGFYACKDNSTETPAPEVKTYPAIIAKFGTNIDLANLPNYANQSVPSYITKDNTVGNSITDKGALLGRVLFYDKLLSSDKSVACASCHLQANAFGDAKSASVGVNGSTGRHSMRLINSRFADETKFFWDERATTLELQTTQPIQDHSEMGYSGQNGDPSLTDLIAILQQTDYYQELFELAFGDATVTEERMQKSLAQFVRSIQSFDSKYDIGRATAANDGANFSNFTAQENAGKQLFLAPPQFGPDGVRTAGGAGCQGCHRAPEFDIDPASGNNGIIGKIGGGGNDFTNTRAPTLRDIINPSGSINSLFMHNANFGAIQGVLSHYNQITTQNPQIDRRLIPGGNPQNLNLTGPERQQIEAFLKTLTGSDVYTNQKWSNPFQ
jgi:cytochrome c peroxidase